jgi:hypothetical protein
MAWKSFGNSSLQGQEWWDEDEDDEEEEEEELRAASRRLILKQHQFTPLSPLASAILEAR